MDKNRIHVVAVVVTLLFTMGVGFWMLAEQQKRMMELQAEQEESYINWTDTVSSYDSAHTYNLSGYNITTNITERKGFADIYFHGQDSFHLRINGPMEYFTDSLEKDIALRHIKFHKYDVASAFRTQYLDSTTKVITQVHPIATEFKGQIVFYMDNHGKVVPKFKPEYNYK